MLQKGREKINGKKPLDLPNWAWLGVSEEKALASLSSTLAWRIPWAEEPGGLQSKDWATSLSLSLSCIVEGNVSPLQCSCLENPRDGGAWWAAVYGVAESRTRLKRLSSSSSRSFRSTSWNQDCREKYQWPQIRRWHHPYGRKWRRTKQPLDESERGEWKLGLKLNIQKTKIMESGPTTSWQIDGETVEAVSDFIFRGLQNHCRWWLQPWN